MAQKQQREVKEPTRLSVNITRAKNPDYRARFGISSRPIRPVMSTATIG